MVALSSYLVIGLALAASGSCSPFEERAAVHREASRASSSHGDAKNLLYQAIEALGGKNALSSLKGVAFNAYLYRSQTLMESVTPGYADNTIATAGNATISYDLSGDLTDIRRRDDRQYYISEYWYFGKASLPPLDVSLVTRNNYSCYVRGNEGVYQPNDQLGGYQDPAYSRILLRDATRLSPKLLLMMEANIAFVTVSDVDVRGLPYPSITDNSLNLTVILDPVTKLPYIIRAYEDHYIYGKSKNDLLVYNYTSVGGVQLPRRLKYMYNEENMLFDSIIGDVQVNPSFPKGFFDGLPLNLVNITELGLPPLAPMVSSEYGDAEVFEFSQNLLWYGGYAGKLSNLTITHPLPGVPKLWHLSFNDATAYAQTIAEFTDRVMVVDAPPHQSKLVIEWINNNLKKPISHLLVTHHHHDHNYGAIDFVAVGATLVVPEDYKYYWTDIPGVKFATVTEDKPFVYKDANMQVRAIWHKQNVHANDWMYFTWTPPCPTDSDTMAITVADPWSPGLVGYEFNQFAAITYLNIARKDRVPKKNLVIPLHGVPTNVSELYALTGYSYPDYNNSDFLPGGPWC